MFVAATRKKKVSKITMPNDGQNKVTLHAFRADKQLTKLLAGVPDKSAFITDALREKFGSNHFVACPMCGGEGKVPRVAAKCGPNHK